MKKLNIAATGYYGSTESWKWVASAYEMIADALAKLVHPTSPVIITGVVSDGTSVTDGFIAYGGELFQFVGGSVTDTLVIVENTTSQEYNTDPSGTGTLPVLPTYIDRYAKCGQPGEGIDDFDFNELKRLDALIDINKLTQQATETARGTLKIAPQTIANADTDDTMAITAKKLAARVATETRAGVLPIANDTEALSGADDTKAITSKKLKTVIDNSTFGVVDSFTITGISVDGDEAVGASTFNLTNSLTDYIIVANVDNGDAAGPIKPVFNFGIYDKTSSSFGFDWSVYSRDRADNITITIAVIKIA